MKLRNHPEFALLGIPEGYIPPREQGEDNREFLTRVSAAEKSGAYIPPRGQSEDNREFLTRVSVAEKSGAYISPREHGEDYKEFMTRVSVAERSVRSVSLNEGELDNMEVFDDITNTLEPGKNSFELPYDEPDEPYDDNLTEHIVDRVNEIFPSALEKALEESSLVSKKQFEEFKLRVNEIVEIYKNSLKK